MANKTNIVDFCVRKYISEFFNLGKVYDRLEIEDNVLYGRDIGERRTAICESDTETDFDISSIYLCIQIIDNRNCTSQFVTLKVIDGKRHWTAGVFDEIALN